MAAPHASLLVAAGSDSFTAECPPGADARPSADRSFVTSHWIRRAMYIPASHAEHRAEVLYAFLDAHPFAVLVTASAEGLVATHLPIVLDQTRGPHGTLEGHIARANAQHRQLSVTSEALVIFSGPNAYITPTWYPSKAAHGKVVPTWNYVAVHAYGVLRFREDDEFLRRHLAQLTRRHEEGREKPWAVADAPADYLAQQRRAIVGVELEITRLEGKWKMSQNRSAEDIDGVVAGLSSSASPDDREVAAIVDGVRPHR
jgi:transcriptional regulator